MKSGENGLIGPGSNDYGRKKGSDFMNESIYAPVPGFAEGEKQTVENELRKLFESKNQPQEGCNYMTRAKFTCVSVTKSKHWNPTEHEFTYAAKFNAVTGNSEENKKFFAATPSGLIEISTVVSDVFEPGKNYFIDFTPCE